MYAIIDIETTGGKYDEEGITEIAIYRFDGHEVTDQFISLINPERPIQDFVVKLTGINNRMLRNAPKFYEVAKRIVEITEGCSIVAHNASFDYRILQTEFRRLGYDFVKTTLCTVELAKQLLPERETYSLGKLVHSLGIPMSERHRASGDALATLHLFKYLLEKDTQKNIIITSVKNDTRIETASRHLKILDELPEKLGVFYMHNEEGKIIFVGKHKNIKQHVNKIFTTNAKQERYLQRHTHRVTYEETGNMLIANLKYSEFIYLHQPKCNSRPLKDNEIGEPATYRWQQQSIALIGKGRRVGEKSVVLIIDGDIKGYGFISLNFQFTKLMFLENLITPICNTAANRRIISDYWLLHPYLKVLNLNEQKPFNNE